jgi:hypothetical protein
VKSLLPTFAAVVVAAAAFPLYAGEEPAGPTHPDDKNGRAEPFQAQQESGGRGNSKKITVEFVQDGLKIGDRLVIGSYFQLWYRPYEAADNGAIQPNTEHEGAQISSGFSFRRVRLSADAVADRFAFRLELGFETGFTMPLLDVWVKLHCYKGYADIVAGQMKIPSTYENLESSSDLDLITMSTLSEYIPNWQLSRHANETSPFYGNRANQRDMGLGFRGNFRGFGYFLMVGNGLGANFGIGGSEYKQQVFANGFGAYFYGVRMSLDFAELFRQALDPAKIGRMEVGGHFSYNNHANMVYTDQKSVFDLDRLSWSADMHINITKYLRLTGMYGQGYINDGFLYDGKTDYRYSGWEVKIMAAPIPETLELGVRADSYTYEYSLNGEKEQLMSYTFGVSWKFWDHFRLDANYKLKRIWTHLKRDPVGDVMILQFQAKL